MRMTRHAHIRCQQRGIPPLIINWLLTYGATRPDGCGGTVYFFDGNSRRQLEGDCGRQIVSRLSDYLGTYAIVIDERVITTGHRYKPIRTH